MNNGCIVPITCGPKSWHFVLSLLDDEDLTSMCNKGQTPTRILVTKQILIPSNSHRSFEVLTKLDVFIMVYLDSKLFTNQNWILTEVIAKFRSDERFKVFVASSGSAQIELWPQKAINKDAAHAVNLVDWQISHGESLSLIPDEPSDGRLCKQHMHHKNINTNRNYWEANQRERNISAYLRPKTDEDITINISPYQEATVREIIWKHEGLWSG